MGLHWEPSYREVNLSDLRSVKDLADIAFDSGLQLGAGKLTTVRQQALSSVTRREGRLKKETSNLIEELLAGVAGAWNTMSMAASFSRDERATDTFWRHPHGHPAIPLERGAEARVSNRLEVAGHDLTGAHEVEAYYLLLVRNTEASGPSGIDVTLRAIALPAIVFTSGMNPGLEAVP